MQFRRQNTMYSSSRDTVEFLSAVESCSGKVLVASSFFVFQGFLIPGALHAGGFLHEDARKHALKEHSQIVNNMKHVMHSKLLVASWSRWSP